MNAIEFTNRLRILMPEFEEIEERLTLEFRPEPAGIVSLCAEAGWQIAANFHSIPNPGALFEVIEAAMASGDDTLSTAVATGLIEGLISSSDNRPGEWGMILPYLGVKSKAYADAWIEFTDTGSISA
ncbi:hypothetical protein J2045_000282 [Peteryoungia aggregata LMG 23059]|uniref:DUF7674 domain-containing protein n=1 Tax=Peteryoungia aggregata LMG 23059 TaxID=1368425 RepID=A0ABU0G3H6_9HYPH|nr:hypothetical protein [Peteryoungia aggregata]MDQ0419272.1 hypothetical protein [Peteryoungia aggregata LMG 23059]